jgi:hypothetical protein
MESFTKIKFTELNGDNINSLTNVITLDGGVHHFYGQLKVWFEAVPVRCAFLYDMDRNYFFAIPFKLVQDKPTTYIFSDYMFQPQTDWMACGCAILYVRRVMHECRCLLIEQAS